MFNSLEGVAREGEGKGKSQNKLMVCNWQINYR